MNAFRDKVGGWSRPRPRRYGLITLLLAAFLPAICGAQLTPAQWPTPEPTSSARPEAPANKNGPQDINGQNKADAEQSGTSKDRLFYALPNFLTLENGANVPPLTTKQKFAVVARGTFDPVQYPWWGLLAAIAQADNSEPGYGQGWVGYGKRYGATAADSTIENFMVGAVFASALHQDPRFFPVEQRRICPSNGIRREPDLCDPSG